MLKKKNMFVSKHNIFTKGSIINSVSKKKTVKKTTSAEQKALNDAKATIKTRFADPLLQLTSLDFLLEDEGTVDDISDDSMAPESANASDAEQESAEECIKQESRQSIKDRSSNLDYVIKHKTDISRDYSTNSKRNHSFRRSPFKRQGFISTSVRSERSPTSATSALNSGDISYCDKEIMDLLHGLQSELKYYEELSGRRSVFDPAVLYELYCMI